MTLRCTLVAAALFACAGNALAVVYEGTTAGGDLWNRPLEGEPPPSLSKVGTAVPYTITPFTVSVSGTYAFISQGVVPVSWDNFTLLYEGSFDAASPLTNALIGNDDFDAIGLSGFTYELTTGASYFFITTGYDNSSLGTYSNVIIGPGQVVIPGPIFLDGFESASTAAWSESHP